MTKRAEPCGLLSRCGLVLSVGRGMLVSQCRRVDMFPLSIENGSGSQSPSGRGEQMMHNGVQCEFPPGDDGTMLLERFQPILEPELDESILQLGFIQSLHVHELFYMGLSSQCRKQN